jgi:hypothetical protein
MYEVHVHTGQQRMGAGAMHAWRRQIFAPVSNTHPPGPSFERVQHYAIATGLHVYMQQIDLACDVAPS